MGWDGVWDFIDNFITSKFCIKDPKYLSEDNTNNEWMGGRWWKCTLSFYLGNYLLIVLISCEATLSSFGYLLLVVLIRWEHVVVWSKAIFYLVMHGANQQPHLNSGITSHPWWMKILIQSSCHIPSVVNEDSHSI